MKFFFFFFSFFSLLLYDSHRAVFHCRNEETRGKCRGVLEREIKSSSKLVVRTTNGLASERVIERNSRTDISAREKGEKKLRTKKSHPRVELKRLARAQEARRSVLFYERNRALVEPRKRVRPRWIFRERRHFFGWIERKKKKRSGRKEQWKELFL